MIEPAATDDRVVTAAGLVARSSLDYVVSVFRLCEDRHPFVSIASPAAAAALTGVRIDAIVEPGSGAGWLCDPHGVEHGADTAQIAFTSGTTGAPKGIILTYDALADTTERLIAVQRLDSSVREYVGVPPNYSFGLGRYRTVAAVGGHSFMPANGFDPAEIGRMLRNREINALAAVPTLLRVLIDQADLIGTAGRYMRWIEIGSQHMTRAEKEKVKEIFPEASIIQHFGLTEASRTTFLDISNIAGHRLASVGQPVGATEIGLSPEGCVRIRGPHVARAWIGAGGVSPLLSADGWLTTNDLGEIDEGFLYVRGRVDDLINFGGVKLVPDLIEDCLRARYVTPPRLAVARIDDPLRGDGVLVATDDEAAVAELRSLALEVLATFGVAAGSGLRVAVVAELPFTATGKIQRRALAAAVAAESMPQIIGVTASDKQASEVLRTFRLAFPRRVVGRNDSLMSLGGDSLAHVSILSRLDEPVGRLPLDWEEYSIAELEALLSITPRTPSRCSHWRTISSDVVLRALAVAFIVAHHVLGRDLGGGIDVLLLLAGLNLARFQTRRLASAHRWSLLRDVVLKMVFPYYALLAILAVFYHQRILAADILLVSNFVGRYDSLRLAALWFVQAYFQSVLVLAGIATVPSIRRMIIKQPGYFGVYLLAACLIVKFACLLLFNHAALLGRTPDQFLYIVALGWCIHEARTRGTRLAVAIAAFTIMLLDTSAVADLWSGFDGRWHTTALFVTTLILLYLPVMRLPRLLCAAVISVATASLMIYISHPLLIDLLAPVFRQPLIVFPHERTLSLLMTVAIILLAIALNSMLVATLRFCRLRAAVPSIDIVNTPNARVEY